MSFQYSAVARPIPSQSSLQEYALTVPPWLTHHKISSALVETICHHDDLARAYEYQLKITDQHRGYHFHLRIAPFLTHTAAAALTVCNVLSITDEYRFWQEQGLLKHRTLPLHIRELSTSLDATVLHNERRKLRQTRGRDPPFRPEGPWTYHPHKNPEDLTHNATLSLPMARARHRPLTAILPALLEGCWYLKTQPAKIVFAYHG